MLNESIIMIVESFTKDLSVPQITFSMKLMIVFGIVYIFQTLGRTGANALSILIYVYAFFKWIIFKLMGKDI